MKFYKWPTSHILSPSIWKWFFYQNFKMSHNYSHHLKKHPIMIFLSNFSHHSQIYSNHMESQSLANATNFQKKKKNISIIFWIYLHFLIHCDTFFFAQIYSSLTLYEIKKRTFFGFDFFGFWPTIIWKNIVKIF
jgi:hypothetical protein